MSWIQVDEESPFSIENIPFGVMSTAEDHTPRVATIVGDTVIDLKAFNALGGLDHLNLNHTVFNRPNLNDFAALGRETHRAVRAYLKEVVTKGGRYGDVLENNHDRQSKVLINVGKVKYHLPMHIGDYTDFYVGRNHAYNCGVLFRGPDNALQPNYYHLPVGYHGRASSVMISGTDFRRPCGQTPGKNGPVFGPSKKVDFELELAMFVSLPNNLGERINVNDAEKHIFGYVLMNDWSARDLQAWEYVPLGPFTAKNWGTVISPWIVLHDALKDARTKPLERDGNLPALTKYLQEEQEESVFDVALEVELTTSSKSSAVISSGSSKNMLYSFQQMLAHHTITGCNLQTGDLIASGTISDTSTHSLGSLLEMSHNGTTSIKIGGGSSENGGDQRTFLENGDRITFRGSTGPAGKKVGFGEVTSAILEPLQE